MGGWAWLVASFSLAAVFAVAGLAKLADLRGSRRAVGEFGVPPRLAGPFGILLPVAELAVAAMLLVPSTARVGAAGAFAMLVTFASAIAWNLSRGRAPDCQCFGQVHSAPASRRTVARNLALATLAGAIAVAHQPSVLSFGETVTVAVAVVLVAAVLVVRGAGDARVESESASQGLPLESPAPAFSLPALDGSTVTLDSLLRRRSPVLLVFTDPQCGPCIELAPEVARWQREHSEQLTVAVIERVNGHVPGRADEHGRLDVLLQADDGVSTSYRADGTPTALLIGADGTIASPPAAGADAIEMLVARAVGAPAVEPAREPPALDLARPLVRREFVMRLVTASAAVGTVLAWPVSAVGDVRRGLAPCPRPWQRRCGTRCVTPLTDERNCGLTAATACGHRCPPGRICAGGNCLCPGDGSRCNVALRGDGPDLVRTSQACPPSTPGQCFAGQICCQGSCVDPTRTPNCGGCGRRPAGRRPACCQGLPRDLYSNRLNCGACFRRCPADKPICYAGRCRSTCGPTLRSCGRDACFNPRIEMCCHGRVLRKNACGCNCRPPRICCGNAGCVDPRFSPHCGRCYRRCQGPPGVGCVCRNGQCVHPCVSGKFVPCDQAPRSGPC
jgi:uncharacterized membrane protein YphA (DoxX/SURF4 family)/thiol-disulfide isomerase/thioredoxin